MGLDFFPCFPADVPDRLGPLSLLAGAWFSAAADDFFSALDLGELLFGRNFHQVAKDFFHGFIAGIFLSLYLFFEGGVGFLGSFFLEEFFQLRVQNMVGVFVFVE